MKLYTQQELEKLTLANLKTIRKGLYKRIKGDEVRADVVAYLIRLKAEIAFRKL